MRGPLRPESLTDAIVAQTREELDSPMHTLTRALVAGIIMSAPMFAGDLINGDAEAGTLTPWVADLSGASSGSSPIIGVVPSQLQTGPTVLPASGSAFFTFGVNATGASGSFVEMSQTQPVDASAMSVCLTGKVQTELDDFGTATIEFRDVVGTLLSSVALDFLNTQATYEWTDFSVTAFVPPGAHDCTVRLRGTVLSGSFTNVFWDDLDLDTSTWTDLGNGLAGIGGMPRLTGAGCLLPDSAMELRLDNALPMSPAFLVVGFSEINVPFKGGTLVPSVDLDPFAFQTSALGSLVIPATWPTGVPSGLSFFMQFWILDAPPPPTFAASNGIRATTP